MKRIFQTLLAASFAMASMPAQADPFVLDNGRITIGIDEYGGLGGGGVGLIGPGGDAVMRGCLCEGWGASADSVSAYTYGGVTNNIRSANAVSNLPGFPLYGRSLATLENGLEVSHAYTSVADGRLFRVQVTLWNVELQTLRDVRYARTLDLDVAPGFFDDNYTTIYGGSPNGPAGPVLSTSANPVGVPDPMVLRPEFQNVNLTDRGGDLGSYFVLSFGDLGRSESISFDMYIGATDSVSELMDAFKSVGIEAFTYTTGNLTGDDMHPAPAFGYGFAGLGLPAWSPNEVPEPASIALLAAGAAGMALRRRRGSRAV